MKRFLTILLALVMILGMSTSALAVGPVAPMVEPVSPPDGGTDTEADLVFDVRCLPNPFYVEELKEKTGLMSEVRDYVMNNDESQEFYKRLVSFIECAVPLYVKEGKSQLVIAFGCTGGKHRSVTFAELIAKHLKEQKFDCITVHRDIKKR